LAELLDSTAWACRNTPALTRWRRSPREGVITVLVAALLYYLASTQEQRMNAVIQGAALLVVAYLVVPLAEFCINVFRAPSLALQRNNDQLGSELKGMRERAERAEARVATLEDQRSNERVEHWKELSEKFRELLGYGINAELVQHLNGTEEWNMNGNSTPHVKAFINTCEWAGQLLVQSKAWAAVPSNIKIVSDKADQWLEYVRVKDGVEKVGDGIDNRPGHEDKTVSYLFRDLPLSSKRLCDECGLKERMD
jgi:hypothetical protein